MVYKMRPFWFLVFSAHLAIASSLVEFKDNDPRPKQGGMKFNLYHATSLDSSHISTSPFSFSDMITKEEERVRSLHSKLAKKDDGVTVNNSGTTTTTTTSSSKPKGQKLVSTPLKSGLPIGSGNYYVKIGLGTPAKYFSMIVDTGSSLSWLQCQPCVIYCHQQVDPLFTPSTSKTYKYLPCSSPQCSSLKSATLNAPSCSNTTGSCVYKASYGDTSFSIGYLSQDVLTFAPSQAQTSFVYGCGQNNEGLFGRAAGIIGLANDKLSLLTQLSNKYGNAFSYCLPTSFSSPNSSKVGYLTIGTSSLTSTSSYKFTPLFKDPKIPSLYFVDLTSITVAGKPLGVAASSYKVPTILDSGTVITRLPVPIFTALQKAFVTIMSKKYAQATGISILNTCFKGSVKAMSKVPEIEMIFGGGAGLVLKAHNTLIEIEKGVTCLAIASSSEANPIAIIGNYQQQTFNMAYDVGNSKVGFAAGGCQ